MQTTSITIQGKTFSCPQPFAAGHVLNEAEASTLNQTFAENLRNNFGARMKKAAEDKDNPQVLGQDEFDKYAAEYKFGVRVAGTRAPVDPIEREARVMAAKAVRDALKRKKDQNPDFDPKSVADEEFEKLVDGTLEKYPAFREQAKQIVAARQAAVSTVEV